MEDAQNEDLEGMGIRDLLAWGRSRNGDLLTPSEREAEQTLLRKLDEKSELAKSVVKSEKLRRRIQEKNIENNAYP